MLREIVWSIGLMLAASCIAPEMVAAAPQLDLTSEPPGVLSPQNKQKLWDAYKIAKICMEHPQYGQNGVSLKVATVDPKSFKTNAWVSPFTAVTGASACEIDPDPLLPPNPISVVKLDEAYGERQQDVDQAAVWFRRLSTYLRYSGDPIARDLIKQTLVAWAKGKGLGKGIHVSWGAKPVDYQMIATILSILTATAQVAPELTPEDRAVIGPWLNDLVKQAAASRWRDREDNKAFMRSYLAMVWGLMVGDDRPVQEAVYAYKLAIHDMRPDGSWPIESQRGGMGLHYNSAATSHVFMIATALKEARGIDLFGYAVDGRSIHTAIERVVQSIQNPSLNKQYAISCPDSGDRFGTIEAPAMFFVEQESGYLVAYADIFPERGVSKTIQSVVKQQGAMDSEKSGGPPACLFAKSGGKVNLAALAMPGPPPKLPAPTFKVTTKEEWTNRPGRENQVNTLFASSIAGGKRDQRQLEFKVEGSFDYGTESFSSLKLVVMNVGLTRPKGLDACGVRTDVYDEGQHHVIIEFTKAGDVFTAPKAECIFGALPPKFSFQAKFLLTSFRDIAIGLVATGAVESITNEGLRTFIRRVAVGEASVGL